MLGDNGSDTYNSYWCYGGTHWPPPPPLELVIEGEVRSAAHRLWSLGCWSHLYSSWAHSSILMQLHRLDPVFNMGVNVMTPEFNLEPKLELLC